MSVVEFKPREQTEAHNTGPAICMGCKREWLAVAPVGTTSLECPDCGTLKGVFKYTCLREGDHWQCDCGNMLFAMTAKRIYCPNCGVDQQGF